jgi:hexulose-6-phosphate isomerase
VDNSSLGSAVKTSQVEAFFRPITNLLRENNMRIAFETDLNEENFSEFIEEFAEDCFGINYDIGNSASLGFDPAKELEAIGKRIINVHVKDRLLGGTTVPLGSGNADFSMVFKCLKACGYVGNLIMQTARATDDNHDALLARYRDQIASWMEEAK